MSRKKVAHPVKLSVVFEPDDGGWHVHVPSLQGCRTWGRSLSEARRNIREAISLCEEELGDAEGVARDAVFDEDIQLPVATRALLERAAAAKAQAEAATAQAKALAEAAARSLTEASLSLRDAGEFLGLSQEGVRKLLKAEPKNPVLPKDPVFIVDTALIADTNAMRDLTPKGSTVFIVEGELPNGFTRVLQTHATYYHATDPNDLIAIVDAPPRDFGRVVTTCFQFKSYKRSLLLEASAPYGEARPASDAPPPNVPTPGSVRSTRRAHGKLS